MAPPEPILVHDVDDPRLADFTRLTDAQLRMRREPAEGLFLAEGDQVIRRALAAGMMPRRALLLPRWWPLLEDALAEAGSPELEVFLAEDAVLRAVVGFRLHRGALVSFARPEPRHASDVLDDAASLVILEGLVDHTNVGIVFRTAAALGVDGILVSPDCADPLYRRSVKVSMGAVFTMPWARAEAWPGTLDVLKERGYTCLALTPDPHAESLRDVRRGSGERIALLVGSEGPGLSPRALRAVDRWVRIPMHHGVDSLNAAAAVAIALYALTGND